MMKTSQLFILLVLLPPFLLLSRTVQFVRQKRKEKTTKLLRTRQQSQVDYTNNILQNDFPWITHEPHQLDAVPTVENEEIQQHRFLEQQQQAPILVTTPLCNGFRRQGWSEKLELSYYYVVEFVSPLAELSLDGMEDVLLQSVLHALSVCDKENGEPKFAVELGIAHELSPEGFCIAQDSANNCFVARGYTAIYFDEDSSSEGSKLLALAAIRRGLHNRTLLASFAPNVMRGEFLRLISDEVLPLGELQAGDDVTSAENSIKIAIAAGTISFIVALLFSYGLFRRQNKLNEEYEQQLRRYSNRPSPIPTDKRTRRRFFFEELGDEDGVIHVSTTMMGGASPTEGGLAYSISDISEDSASVTSYLSRTTSRLESIAEEPDDDGDEEAAVAITEKDMDAYKEAYEAHRHRLADMIRRTNFESTFGGFADISVDNNNEVNQSAVSELTEWTQYSTPATNKTAIRRHVVSPSPPTESEDHDATTRDDSPILSPKKSLSFEDADNIDPTLNAEAVEDEVHRSQDDLSAPRASALKVNELADVVQPPTKATTTTLECIETSKQTEPKSPPPVTRRQGTSNNDVKHQGFRTPMRNLLATAMGGGTSASGNKSTEIATTGSQHLFRTPERRPDESRLGASPATFPEVNWDAEDADNDDPPGERMSDTSLTEEDDAGDYSMGMKKWLSNLMMQYTPPHGRAAQGPTDTTTVHQATPRTELPPPTNVPSTLQK